MTIDWAIPSMIRPELSWGWLAIVVAAVAIYTFWFRPEPSGLAVPPPPVALD